MSSARDDNLNLLCLDGGGVRGLSSLYILEHLMKTINLTSPPKPCDVFDMIGGTSTGGLIAIMLGRLQMHVSECIEVYLQLTGKIFKKKSKLAPVGVSLKIRGRYSSKTLEDEIKKLCTSKGLDEDELLQDPENKCKVFVCATSGITSSIALLKSYSAGDSSGLNAKTKIWEAARATSAAPTFFDPVIIGGRTFGDGATGANNPIEELWNEAIDVYGKSLKEKINCIVSVGTGVPDPEKFGESAGDLVKALQRMATETEEKANRFQRAHPELVEERRQLFRFNASGGLKNVKLDDATQNSVMHELTIHYLRQDEVRRMLKSCAENMGDSWPASGRPVADFNTPTALVCADILKRREWKLLLSRLGNENFDLLSALSDYDALRSLNRLRRKVHAKTTDWILLDPRYVGFRDKSAGHCLWLSGIIGSGKTLLTTTILDDTIRNQSTLGFAIGHHFFEESSRDKFTTVAMFESLAKQLLVQMQLRCTKCPDTLMQNLLVFYGPRMARPDLDELVDLILIPLAEVTFGATLLIDGLDLCPKEEIMIALLSIKKLLARKVCKIYISTRQDLDLLSKLPNCSNIQLTKETNHKSMEIFIREEINQMTLERTLSENSTVMNLMRDILLEKADGMFLWAKFQIQDIIEECRSDSEIKQALRNLPKNLNATYQRCLDKVPTRDRGRALQVLRFLAIAAEPFYVNQIQEALAMDIDTGQIHSTSQVHPDLIIKSCGSLAVIEEYESGPKLILAHHSIKPFISRLVAAQFETNVMPLDPLTFIEVELGQMCINCLYGLSQDALILHEQTPASIVLPSNFLPGIVGSTGLGFLTNKLLKTPRSRSEKTVRAEARSVVEQEKPVLAFSESSFSKYAERNWVKHTKQYGPNMSSGRLEEMVLSQRHLWFKLPWQSDDVLYNRKSKSQRVQSMYAWAIINQHLPLIRLAMAANVDSSVFSLPLSLPGAEFGSLPLHVAAKYRNERLALCLLSDKEIFNPKGLRELSIYERMLSERNSFKERPNQNSINLEIRDENGMTALMCAAKFGCAGICMLLVDYGADLFKVDKNEKHALRHAAESGSIDTCKVLMDTKYVSGYNLWSLVSRFDSSGETVLHYAIRSNSSPLITHFFHDWPSIRRDDMYFSIPYYAIAYSTEPPWNIISRFFRENDSDPTYPSHVVALCYALWTAVHFNRPDIVRSIIADFSGFAILGPYPNAHMALHPTCRGSALMEEFLEQIRKLTATYESPIHYALLMGRDEAADIILNMTDSRMKFHSVDLLIVAIEKDCPLSAKTLLQRTEFDANSDSSINVASIYGELCGPLTLAIHSGSVKVVELLISAKTTIVEGANVSALMYAIELCNEPIALRLIERDDCDVNRRDSSSNTPLMNAVHSNLKLVVEALLKRHDINVRLRDRNGDNVYDLAFGSKDPQIVSLLESYREKAMVET